MPKRRISVAANGQDRLILEPPPQVSGALTAWKEFLLEQHWMPVFLAFPPNMQFAGNLIGVTLSDTPPTTYRSENGREKSASLFNGRIRITSVVVAEERSAASSWRLRECRDGLSADCLRRVLGYIEANLAHDLGVHAISQVALISPYYFGKLFKRSTGQTFHQYVLGQRIRKAQNLLATSDIALVEVASSVGLPNQSHFTTVFRIKTGVTPGYFRSTVKRMSR